MGARVLMSVEAMLWLLLLRAAMSPAMRWEKNSTGIRSTCHMNSAFALIASLP